MKIEGVIIAGGEAARMKKQEKPLMLLRGQPQLARLDEALARKQLRAAPRRQEALRRLEEERLASAGLGLPEGLLGGVLAALDGAAARGATWLATFPADTPFLPHDLVARLAEAAHEGAPSVAVTEAKVQGLCALWPVGCRARLAEGMEAGRYRSLWWTLDDLSAVRCRFDDETAFFNVNTEDDLEEAEAIARLS